MNGKRFEIDGETYIKLGNQWVDSTFIIPPTNIIRRLVEKEFEGISFETMPLSELKNIINEIKKAECFHLCLKAVDCLIKRTDLETLYYYIAVKVSCLRAVHDAMGAIEYCKEIKYKYGAEMLSVHTLTSLAAAYCDIEDWLSAKKTANYAYKRQGGGVGYTNELALVYKRIDANT